MAIDLQLTAPESNQMWIKWKKVEREGSGVVKLKKAEFYGPVLSDCDPIEDSGFIRLDLTKHFIILIPRPYIVELKWDKLLSQTRSSVKFEEIILTDTEMGHLPKLTDKDRILLDCSDHTTEKMSEGVYKFAFEAMLYKETLEPYDF